jgi:hypothetical protein
MPFLKAVIAHTMTGEVNWEEDLAEEALVLSYASKEDS